MINRVKILWSNLVFWFKCRAGFKLLEEVGPISGIVETFEVSTDGDTCFDLIPARVSDLLTWKTPGAIHASALYHCEIVPADRDRLATEIAKIVVGARVTVSGRRAWDGCHHGRGLFWDVIFVLLRAAPVADGWIEIHPVSDLKVS